MNCLRFRCKSLLQMPILGVGIHLARFPSDLYCWCLAAVFVRIVDTYRWFQYGILFWFDRQVHGRARRFSVHY
jgi:hypothetical protein